MTQLLGRQHSDPSLQQMSHLDFPPELGSNSIFNPQPAETGGVHQLTSYAKANNYDVHTNELMQLLNTSAS